MVLRVLHPHSKPNRVGKNEDEGKKSGTRGGGRTHNLRLRRPTLYPIELRAHAVHAKI